MKTDNFFRRAMAMLAMGMVGFAISCSEDEAPFQEEAAYVAEDVITDLAFEDADDLAGLALISDDGPSTGGRVAEGPRSVTINDPRCSCDNLTITITMSPNSTPEWPIGDIVIDFGDGCEDIFGNVRKGKILIHFEGRRFLPESFVVITFDGYSINGIKLGGVRTLTNIMESKEDAPTFRIHLDDGSATWPDGTVATREHCFVRRWVRASNFLNDQLEITQCENSDNWPYDYAAAGTNRRGRNYTMSILEKIVYKRGCPIPVSGVKEFTDVESGKVIIIDYGDGKCDRAVKIIIGGESTDVNVGKRG
jgi:hypothetical protein